MTLLRHVRPFVSHLPLVRPALRRAYRAGYHVLERTRLTKPNMLPAVRVSPLEMRAFFGYYDKSPWDPSGRYLLFLSSAFDDRMPGAKDVAQICLLDLSSPTDVRIIGETRAWCWQQGAMLQWLGATQQIVFNDLVNNEYVSRIIGLNGNQIRLLPRPIYALSKGGGQAVSLDFERIHCIAGSACGITLATRRTRRECTVSIRMGATCACLRTQAFLRTLPGWTTNTSSRRRSTPISGSTTTSTTIDRMTSRFLDKES
jgi:hypothetical protein